MKKPEKLIFTCGDPAGIGPEVIRAWIDANPASCREIALAGPQSWLESFDLHGAEPLPVGGKSFSAKPGKPDLDGARVAFDALEVAAQKVRGGEYQGVVTGPVSKAWLLQAGYPFPGQTEFFADRWGGEPTMAFCGGRLRVSLLTWHIPFREVPGRLTAAAFERTVNATVQLARACGPVKATGTAESDITTASAEDASCLPEAFEPRIGVCGLNPHAGEGGMLGTEEREIIDPILDRLRSQHPGLSRCEPGDTVFGRQLRGEFDAVIALYHDQGLAPLKTIDFDESVNVTLGLPHVRTSPDHGTAFGIAGQGRACGTSFANAVRVARRLIRLGAR
jgi:4-hydroxythreonine-4-phosphate dehydrogenase